MDERDGDALRRLGTVQQPVATRDTSLAAQAAIQNAKSDLQRRVYEYLFTCGNDGATDEEIQISIGMDGSTERPRRRELEKAGAIINSGRVRPTTRGRQAVVWTVRQQSASQRDTDERDDANRRVSRRNPARFSW